MEWVRATRTHWVARLKPCSEYAHVWLCANCNEKNGVWGVSVYTPVACSGSLSTVNATNCNKKKITQNFLMSSLPIPFRFDPPRCAWRGMPYLVLFWRKRSSTCSPHSWCRRFLIETAARKSGRSFIGPFLLVFLKMRYHWFWYLLFSSGVRWYVWSSFASSSHSLHFGSSYCELWFTMNLISEESIVNTCKMSTLRVNFLAASLPRIPGHMVFSLYFGLAVSSTVGNAFLIP